MRASTTTTMDASRKREREDTADGDDDATDAKIAQWKRDAASPSTSSKDAETFDGIDADEDALIEARRKRRAEIMAKHGASKPVKPVTEGVRMVDAGMGRVVANAATTANATTANATTANASGANGTRGGQEKASGAVVKSASMGDMFGEDSDEDALYMNEETKDGAGRATKKTAGAVDMSRGLADNWDDAEGYYCARIGEILDKRYTITAHLGRGVFSNVLRAVDSTKEEGENEVAIKVIRCNETMYKAAQLEIDILQKLSGSDPENKRHCVKFLRHFEYRDHIFMVFESLSMNLREVIKKFGRNIGINIKAVQSYARQMLISLRHLKNNGVVHADIKPDNILVNEGHNVLKLCDFGSAMFDGDNELTPYLVSRFYRAPEVILGLPYSHPMDLWSVGCCLYELFTGNVAFPGRSNNHMLKLMLELKGPVPKKLLRRALFKDNHYDVTDTFSVIEEDPVTKKSIRRLIRDAKPSRDLAKIFTRDSDMSDAEKKKALQLADLLDKMFNMDPEKRITAAEALQHPFVVDRVE
jgi:serine/threonine-protein kinase PRP4